MKNPARSLLSLAISTTTFVNLSMNSLKSILLPIAVGFGIATSANANVVTVTSPVASATITTDPGSVSVILTNNIQNPSDPVDILTGFTFTLSDTLGTNALVSSGGSQLTVHPDGTYVVGFGGATDWGLSSVGKTFNLSTGSLGWNEGIIGFSDAGNYTSGAYSAAGSWILSLHPYFESGTMFNLAAAGVTADTTVTDATFYFYGEPSTGTITVNPTSVPDSGATVALLGLGLVGLTVPRRIKNGIRFSSRVGKGSAGKHCRVG